MELISVFVFLLVDQRLVLINLKNVRFRNGIGFSRTFRAYFEILFGSSL